MKSSSASVTARKRGRPPTFDRQTVVRKAMLVFWKKGYEGTSLSDLTAAMNVTPPSIYAAFGDKKGLFLEAVDCYLGSPPAAETLIDHAASARDAATALLTSAAVGYTGRTTPAGCLLASAAIACSDDASEIRAALTAIRVRIEKHLERKIDQDIASGELPDACDAIVLAGLVMAVIQGMSTLARDGAKRDKLMAIAAASMVAWPSGGSVQRDIGTREMNSMRSSRIQQRK